MDESQPATIKLKTNKQTKTKLPPKTTANKLKQQKYNKKYNNKKPRDQSFSNQNDT